jgi:hypothetical protein
LLTVLGHACELPIGLALTAHAHDDAEDAAEHHSDDSQFECDPVLGIRSSTHTSSTVAVDVHAGPYPVLDTVAFHVVTARPDLSSKRHRPPLFLLHAALLI